MIIEKNAQGNFVVPSDDELDAALNRHVQAELDAFFANFEKTGRLPVPCECTECTSWFADSASANHDVPAAALVTPVVITKEKVRELIAEAKKEIWG